MIRIFVLIFTIASCTHTPASKIQRTQVHMGTLFHIELPKKHQKLFPQLFARAKELDAKLSTYQWSSEISRLNRGEKFKTSNDTERVLKIADRIEKLTNGYFNAKLGQYTARFQRDSRIKPKTSQYDLGGIGKGFAIDELSSLLERNQVHHAVLAASGDIRCISICDFSLQSPQKETVQIAGLRTLKTNTSMSTSGSYRIYMSNMADNHLINAKTKKPQKNFLSVTLFGHKNNTELDAITTAVSTMPAKKALHFLKKQKIPYILFLNDGRKLRSPGLSDWVDFSKSEIASFEITKSI